MQPTEFSWKNGHGHKVYAVEWAVPEARAVVGLIHGIGEHCRRYDHLCRFFADHDIAVVAYDRQGYGRSEGRRGYAESYSEYLDEIGKLLLECEHRYPDLPAFLYGHSLGGHLLLHYLIGRNPNITAAVVSAPHITLAFIPNPLLVGIGKLMRLIVPTFTQENTLDTSKLSRSPEVKPAYDNDPLNHAKISSRTGIDILEHGDLLHAYSGGLPVPTLLMHGTADEITNHAGSAAFAERNRENITLKSWEGLYHELHNEPEQGKVMAFVLEWLEKHMATTYRKPKSL